MHILPFNDKAEVHEVMTGHFLLEVITTSYLNRSPDSHLQLFCHACTIKALKMRRLQIIIKFGNNKTVQTGSSTFDLQLS